MAGDDLDAALERAVVEIARARGPHRTACPSEAARRVAPDDWRGLMERTRGAVQRLVDRGLVEVLQRGRVVDLSTAKGPIRVRIRPEGGRPSSTPR